MTDYFLEHSFKDEELAMNFTLHFPYVLERWEGLKKFARLKYLNDLQTRYGGKNYYIIHFCSTTFG